jgi:hypothetical protein
MSGNFLLAKRYRLYPLIINGTIITKIIINFQILLLKEKKDFINIKKGFPSNIKKFITIFNIFI